MFYNRDEFMLLSGRVVHTSRDGPDRALHEHGPGQRVPEHGLAVPWLLRSMAGAMRGMLEHPRRETPLGPTRPPESYSDSRSYMELEFAVGFGPDEEPWL